VTWYAVGDIQGCLDPLRRLLDSVAFDPGQDRLLAVGDIVNRGPDSLATLRWVHSLGASFDTVLGNHDLHLLAVAAGVRRAYPKDTLDRILTAPDREELLHWLRHRPLLIEAQGHVLVHAGILPGWTLSQARDYATEIESVLRAKPGRLLSELYGDTPGWHEDLAGPPRWRAIINVLTRMRFCDAAGRLDLSAKTGPESPPPGLLPWYAHAGRATRDISIVFGHWAALNGADCGARLFPLDTGCVWGGRLRLMNLSTGRYHHCPC
jgi:bis(5'-nucleosyl)-tetraphosphatase (symmetrical)